MEPTLRLDLYTFAEGEGYPIVLVHDWGASLQDWHRLIPPLMTNGLRVYACDLFGHGASPVPEDARLYYAQMFVSTFRRWIDGLGIGLSPIIVGHGFGAYLALRYAIGHPYKVSKLVLVNPLIAPDQLSRVTVDLSRRPWLYRIARRFFHEWTITKLLGLTEDMDPAVRERVLSNFESASPFILQIFPSLTDLTGDLYSLPTRSLLLLSENDPLLDLSALPEMADEMQDAACQTLPFAGHRPHLEHPLETNQAILDFLVGYN